MTAPEHAIAIVGRAGRFPAARNVAEFWAMLATGRHATRQLSDAELLAAGVPRKVLADPNYVKAAHILPDMEGFDAGFWGFSPREAQILDPQHRHFLETSWEALEDAGHMPEDFDGRIGVFAGSGMQAYMAFNLLSNPDLVSEIGLFLLRHTGNDKDFLPTRLSYLLNLTGPSVAVQTACSTSLVAVHTAVGALLNMECDMALAGGVTIELPHRVGYRYEAGEILSPDGLCRAFDDDSQGTVFGSGAAMVVLRRLTDALEDGDDIKAVILGSAINNDGASKASYLAPSVDGQAEAAAEAVALAGVEPGSISYIEAHGTGTPIGDPIELSALTQVYGDAPAGSIGIGSVKTNIGHLDTAAGAASLIKVVEAMRHETLPESLNFTTPNSRYDWESGPFHVVSETRAWNSRGPRRAAINSLGVGGTNAHVVVEQAPPRTPTADAGGWRVFPFSAQSREALDLTPAKWAPALAQPDAPALADIAFTLRQGRRQFPERMVVAAESHAGLAQVMAARSTGARRFGQASDTPPRIVFLFPGGGAQYPGAGTEMMAASPVFAEAMERCFAALPDTAPADLRIMMLERDLEDAEAKAKLARSDYAIPALFILEYAYAELWQSWGVRPDAIFAHSVGEYAGAVMTGVLGLEDALRVVTLRGALMEAAPKGAMTTVPFCATQAEAYLGDSLDIAAINSTATTVVSGQLDEIEALEARLAQEGHEARRIHIDVAAHSRQLDGQLDAFRAGFEGVVFQAPQTPMVSSLRGDWGTGNDFASADYWTRHLRHTVRFTDAMAATLNDPNTVVIEVGPGQTLGPLVEAAELAAPPRAILPSAPRPRDVDHEMGVALASAGALWTHGWPLEFDRLPGGTTGRRVSVPTYAFEHERHWIEPGSHNRESAEEIDTLTLSRLADPADWIEALDWREGPLLAKPSLADTRWLVFAGTETFSDAVHETLNQGGAEIVTVRQGADFAVIEGGYMLNPERPEDYEALFEALGSAVPEKILSLWGLEDDMPFDSAYLLGRALQLADAGMGRHLGLVAQTSDTKGATLLGLARVAPREIAGLTAALIETSGDPLSAPALIAEMHAAPPGLDHVRLTPSSRALKQRSAMPHEAEATRLPHRLRQGGVYVITGGSGGIGQEMALWLVGTAQARVALLSRSIVADTELAEQCRAAGGDVMTVQTDVTDRASLSAALDAVRAQFGEITGVIHGAGRIDDRPLSAKSLAEAQAVMAPKLTGVHHLDALLPEGSLDFFCVISSSSVVIGGSGQADYAGANAALEALATRRQDGFSIAWGVWRDTGMATREYGAGEAVSDPMPGQRHDAPDGVIRFETRLDPESDWRLTGHKMGGQAIFPGTGYVELAYAAAAQIWPGAPVCLSNIAFEEPMFFNDGLPRRITLQLEPAGAGYAATLLSRTNGETPLRHVTLHLAKAGNLKLPADLRREGPADQPLAGTHAAAQDGLIEFGPRWQTLESLAKSPDSIMGRFALAQEFTGDLGTHPLHPALMDMAWTVGLYGLPEAEKACKLYVPMSVGSFIITGPMPARVTARARRTGGSPGRMATFTVALSDAAGKLVALIEEFTLWAAPGRVTAKQEPPALTSQLLATGIRKSEAPALFSRVFDHPARALVVSPVALDLVRLALEERPVQAQTQITGSGGDISDPVLHELAGIWSDILGVSGIGPEDEFFALGGHSLNAVRMFSRVKRDMGVDLPITTLFDAPTLAALADQVAEIGGLSRSRSGAEPEGGANVTAAIAKPWSPLVRINAGQDGVRPFYMVHGAGGNVLSFRILADCLDPSIPFYGIRALGSDGGIEVDTSIEAMASRYLVAITEVQPEGPYDIGGYSGGGVIAYEMARQLKAAGHSVGRLHFLDTLEPIAARTPPSFLYKLWAARNWSFQFALKWLERRKAHQRQADVSKLIEEYLASDEPIPPELVGYRMTQIYRLAQDSYDTGPYEGDITLYKARLAGTLFLAAGPKLGWQSFTSGDFETHVLNCDHFNMMAMPTIEKIGHLISKSLLERDN